MSKFFYLFVSLFFVGKIFAQNTTIQSDRVTIPKMTTSAKNVLPNKVEGMMVYDSDLKQFSYWTGTAWANFGSTTSTGWQQIGDDISTTNIGNVGIGVTSPSKAQLEIYKNTSSGTSNAIFGSGQGGISIQQNWPTIGYNQYRDAADGNKTKFMSTGYAAVNFLDPSGNLFWVSYGTGNANTVTTVSNPYLSFSPNSTMQVYNKVISPSTGPTVNLLPVALGYFNPNGTTNGVTANITCTYDNANQYYVIDVAGYACVDLIKFVTPVTTNLVLARVACAQTGTSTHVFLTNVSGGEEQHGFYAVFFDKN